MGADSTFLYPNVTSLPGQSGIGQTERLPKKQEGTKGEFDKVFDKAWNDVSGKPDLGQVKQPLKFSGHASQRLQDRKITLDQATMAKVNEAVDKAEAKGVEDTLVITKDAALIVSVKNRTVITALDRNSLSGNVFTNIDGAVVV
jgi:flagellar operon protein